MSAQCACIKSSKSLNKYQLIKIGFMQTFDDLMTLSNILKISFFVISIQHLSELLSGFLCILTSKYDIRFTVSLPDVITFFPYINFPQNVVYSYKYMTNIQPNCIYRKKCRHPQANKRGYVKLFYAHKMYIDV